MGSTCGGGVGSTCGGGVGSTCGGDGPSPDGGGVGVAPVDHGQLRHPGGLERRGDEVLVAVGAHALARIRDTALRPLGGARRAAVRAAAIPGRGSGHPVPRPRRVRQGAGERRAGAVVGRADGSECGQPGAGLAVRAGDRLRRLALALRRLRVPQRLALALERLAERGQHVVDGLAVAGARAERERIGVLERDRAGGLLASLRERRAVRGRRDAGDRRHTRVGGSHEHGQRATQADRPQIAVAVRRDAAAELDDGAVGHHPAAQAERLQERRRQQDRLVGAPARDPGEDRAVVALPARRCAGRVGEHEPLDRQLGRQRLPAGRGGEPHRAGVEDRTQPAWVWAGRASAWAADRSPRPSRGRPRRRPRPRGRWRRRRRAARGAAAAPAGRDGGARQRLDRQHRVGDVGRPHDLGLGQVTGRHRARHREPRRCFEILHRRRRDRQDRRRRRADRHVDRAQLERPVRGIDRGRRQRPGQLLAATRPREAVVQRGARVGPRPARERRGRERRARVGRHRRRLQPRLAAPARPELADQDLLEAHPDVVRVAGPLLGVLDEQLGDPFRDRRIDVRDEFRERRRLLVDVLEQHRHRRGVVEREPAGEQLERDAADRVEVRPRPDPLPHRLLGRHVERRPDRHPGLGQHRGATDLVGRLGDAEVRDLHAALDRHHDVLGLEVAMHDATLLGVREAGQGAFQHAADLRQRHVPDVRPQRPAVDVLHRDVRRALVLEVVEHGDDVRVRERARQPGLAQEAPGDRRIGRVEGAQLLDRDEPVELDLPGEVDRGHATAADLAQHLVAPDRLDDGQLVHRISRTSSRGASRRA